MCFKPVDYVAGIVGRPFVQVLFMPFTGYGLEIVVGFDGNKSLGLFFGLAGVVASF